MLKRSEGVKQSVILPFRKKLLHSIQIGTTLSIWAVLGLAALWIFGALGWYLLANLWMRQLFIPNLVFTTVITVALVLIWAGVIFVFALLWAKYNFHRHYQRNRRKILPMKTDARPIMWKEFILDAESGAARETGSLAEAYDETAAAIYETEKGEEVFAGTPILSKDLKDRKGKLLLEAGESITPEKRNEIYKSGHYMELIGMLKDQYLSEVKQNESD